MKDPRGRGLYDDVPINGGESEFRSFDEDEGGEDLPCMSESCAAGNCDGCSDVDANCCECNCHLPIYNPDINRSSIEPYPPAVQHIDADRMRGPSDWDRECQESGRLNR